MEDLGLYLFLGAAVIVVSVLIYLHFKPKPVRWTSWWEMGPKAPNCGRGTRIYARQCEFVGYDGNAGDDQCKKMLGGNDRKEETYIAEKHCPIKGRYVAFKRAKPASDGEKGLSLAEIKIVDKNGKDLIDPGKATATMAPPPSLSRHNPKHIIDGDYFTRLYMSHWDNVESAITIDLGEEKEIYDIFFHDTFDDKGIPGNLFGTFVQILDKDKKIVFTSQAVSKENIYNKAARIMYLDPAGKPYK